MSAWNRISKHKFKNKKNNFSYYKKETKETIIEIDTGNSFQGLCFEETIISFGDNNKKKSIFDKADNGLKTLEKYPSYPINN